MLYGSSPHTRGAPQASRPGGRRWWIIPAYAGSTAGRGRYLCRRRDHPRIRGEHGEPLGALAPQDGSSPHTRGALNSGPPTTMRRRIIPAYAGSTRGAVGDADGAEGSSPHTRGAPVEPSEMLTAQKDHPRIRGEHHGRGRLRGLPGGSSPHTRGAPMLFDAGRATTRIIPAYAGSTLQVGVEVHRVSGSSPHTRGALAGPDAPQNHEGIIPAYAGSTQISLNGFEGLTDHPRIRGEHPYHIIEVPAEYGSSPHTRGAPESQVYPVGVNGIIPAYAGSTHARAP